MFVGGGELPAETDEEEIVSPKPLRLNVDPDLNPIPSHGDLTLAPGFELAELVQMHLAKKELIQLATTEQSLTLNP